MELVNTLTDEIKKIIKKDFDDYLLFGDNSTEEEKYISSIKIALVEKNNNQFFVGLSKQDNMAYKLGDYFQINKPLEKVEFDKFVRWGNMFLDT